MHVCLLWLWTTFAMDLYGHRVNTPMEWQPLRIGCNGCDGSLLLRWNDQTQHIYGTTQHNTTE